MYSFSTKPLGITHDELCRFNSFNRLITTSQPGWFGNQNITFKPNTMNVSFLSLFIDIGKIHQTKNTTPQPVKIR